METWICTWPRATPLFDNGAQVGLQRIQFGGQVEVQVQPAMVHAFQTENDFAVRGLPAHAGETGHAADAHWSITVPASTNWSSWSL